MDFQDVANVSSHGGHEHNGFGLGACGTLVQAANNVQDLSNGDRVMIIGQDLFGSKVVVSSKQCIRLPESLNPETAASVPYAFATALQGLHNMARLQPDETVLIHSDDSSIMLACVQICQKIGAKVGELTINLD
jgi:polyketide synthase 12